MLEKVDPNGSECNNEDTRVPKKISLRKKFDIPLEHLDFAYVQKCTDVRELEKILKILRYFFCSTQFSYYVFATKITAFVLFEISDLVRKVISHN